MWAKIPFWVKFAVGFTVVVALMAYLQFSGIKHSEFDGMEFALIFILPPMFLLDVMGLREVGWLLMSTILLYVFGMGAILGVLVNKGRNFLKMLSKL